MTIGLKNDIGRRIAEVRKRWVAQGGASKILQDMSGLSETADKHLAKRNELRKELESFQDKETKLIQKKAPLESELSAKKKALQEAKEKLKELDEFKANYNENKSSKELLIGQLEKETEDLKIIFKNTLNELEKTKNEISDVSYDLKAASTRL